MFEMQMFYFLFKAPSLNLKKRTGSEYNLHLKPTNHLRGWGRTSKQPFEWGNSETYKTCRVWSYFLALVVSSGIDTQHLFFLLGAPPVLFVRGCRMFFWVKKGGGNLNAGNAQLINMKTKSFVHKRKWFVSLCGPKKITLT